MNKKKILSIIGWIMVLCGVILMITIIVSNIDIAFKWNHGILMWKRAWKEYICLIIVMGIGCYLLDKNMR